MRSPTRRAVFRSSAKAGCRSSCFASVCDARRGRRHPGRRQSSRLSPTSSDACPRRGLPGWARYESNEHGELSGHTWAAEGAHGRTAPPLFPGPPWPLRRWRISAIGWSSRTLHPVRSTLRATESPARSQRSFEMTGVQLLVASTERSSRGGCGAPLLSPHSKQRSARNSGRSNTRVASHGIPLKLSVRLPRKRGRNSLLSLLRREHASSQPFRRILVGRGVERDLPDGAQHTTCDAFGVRCGFPRSGAPHDSRRRSRPVVAMVRLNAPDAVRDETARDFRPREIPSGPDPVPSAGSRRR